MLRYLYGLLVVILIFSCKNNKKSLTGEQHVEADEFFEAYDKLKLPFTVTDTNINKVADTSTISYNVFTQFVSDTIFNTPFGKDRKLKIHPVGKIEQEGKETYFATVVNSKSQSAVYLSVYDSNKFTVHMPLVATDKDNILNTATIDPRLTIVINKEWTDNNELYYDRLIYAYNNVGIFTTVLTETNAEPLPGSSVSNPLDTFPKKYKYSGDYVKGSNSVLTIRDGKSEGEYLFFIHFNNNNDDEPCEGELRGAFNMVSENAAVFNGSGDPCLLDFTFKASQVIVKENGSCGNHRGIRCFFNDTFQKKKEPKPTSKKK